MVDTNLDVQDGYIPTDTVLDVQDGYIDMSVLIRHINNGLNIKEVKEDGKVSG